MIIPLTEVTLLNILMPNAPLQACLIPNQKMSYVDVKFIVIAFDKLLFPVIPSVERYNSIIPSRPNFFVVVTVQSKAV